MSVSSTFSGYYFRKAVNYMCIGGALGPFSTATDLVSLMILEVLRVDCMAISFSENGSSRAMSESFLLLCLVEEIVPNLMPVTRLTSF